MSQRSASMSRSTVQEVDLVAARRWAATFRRIDRVQFSSSAPEALIHGVGHRLPVTRRVPRRVGLGLVELGYRATGRPGRH